MAGHMRRDKIIKPLSRNHWWPKMAKDVAKCIKSCDTCPGPKQRQRNIFLAQPSKLASKS